MCCSPYMPIGITLELRSKAHDLLQEVGLGHRLNRRPKQMSGGEQQPGRDRPPLIHDPVVIYADEPTGNLDRAGGDRIMQLLRDAQRSANRTLLIVTHDRRFITREDVVLEIEDGRLNDEPSRNGSRRRGELSPVARLAISQIPDLFHSGYRKVRRSELRWAHRVASERVARVRR